MAKTICTKSSINRSEYAIVADGSIECNNDKNKQTIVTRRRIRMIPEIEDLPYMERLRRLNLWTLEERRTRTDLIKVYKIMHSLTTVKFESFFEFENYFRRRGHIYKLKKSFQRGSTSTFLLNVSCTRKFYSGLSHSNFRAQHPATGAV